MTARQPPARLGRGLAALMAGSADPARDAPSSTVELAIDLLEPGPFQPRGAMDDTALEELAESIRSRGVLQPVLLRPHPTAPGRYQIIAGERRWRAAQRAGLTMIPALLRPMADADALAAALVENLQREDLNAIEEAEGLRRLIDEFAMTQESLGGMVGKSRSHIANTLRLLQLPPMVQSELRRGALTAGHARALLAHPEPEKAALADIAQGLSVRQAEALATQRATARRDGEPVARPRDPNTVSLEHDLSGRLGLRVRIDGSDSGTLKIQFQTLDQLDGLVRLLMTA